MRTMILSEEEFIGLQEHREIVEETLEAINSLINEIATVGLHSIPQDQIISSKNVMTRLQGLGMVTGEQIISKFLQNLSKVRETGDLTQSWRDLCTLSTWLRNVKRQFSYLTISAELVSSASEMYESAELLETISVPVAAVHGVFPIKGEVFGTEITLMLLFYDPGEERMFIAEDVITSAFGGEKNLLDGPVSSKFFDGRIVNYANHIRQFFSIEEVAITKVPEGIMKLSKAVGSRVTALPPETVTGEHILEKNFPSEFTEQRVKIKYLIDYF